MHIRGWGADAYNSDLIFPKFPKGPWELLGTLEAMRNPLRSDSWLVECAFRNCLEPVRKTVARAEVGWLPCLLPGTKFENGKLVGDNLYGVDITREYLPLDIEADSLTDIDIFQGEKFARIDDFGNKEMVGHNIVPFWVSRFAGLDEERFRLVGVRHNSDPYAIIIPAAVLAHFYFAGISSKLSQALFGGRLRDIVDFSRCGFLDEERRHFTIAPQANLSDGDCWVLARVLAAPPGSPERSAFNRVHNSLVRAKANDQPTLPKALFPFYGETRLKVLGTRFKVKDGNGNELGKRFFVRRILSCTADWPIEHLTIQRDHVEPVGEDQERREGPITMRKTELAERVNMTWENRPNASIAPVIIPLEEASVRFPALLDKTTSLDVCSYERKSEFGAVFADGGIVDEGSTLPGSDRNSNAAPVDIVSGDQTAIKAEGQAEEEKKKRQVTARSRGTESFLIVLELLFRWDVDVQSVAVSDNTYELEGREFGVFPPLPNGKGWELLGKPRDSGQIERLALAAELKFRGAAGAIYFIEPRDNEPTGCIMLALAPTGRPFPYAAHEEILDGVRKLRRVWGNDSQSETVSEVVDTLFYGRVLEFHRIEHRRTEAASYAEIIFGHLKRTMSPGALEVQTDEQ